MAQHSWSDLWDRQAKLTEHHWKQLENYVMAVHLSGAERVFHEACGCATCKETLAWYATQPVPDTEASETRGVVEDTLTERGKNYGDFTDNADYAQRIKQVFYDSKAWCTMPTYMQEALDLIASKLGRMLSGDPFYLDNWHDIGGYTTLVEQRIKQRSTR